MANVPRWGSFRVRVDASISILYLEYFLQEFVPIAAVCLMLAFKLSGVDFLIFGCW